MKHATDVLREIADDRLMIEYSPAQIEELIGDGDRGLCLDLNHAVKAAVSLGVDYKDYVQGFMRLEPNVFHMSDGMLSEETDEHLGIGEGEYDFRYLLYCVKKNPFRLVTIETPLTNKELLHEHVRNLNKLNRLEF